MTAKFLKLDGIMKRRSFVERDVGQNVELMNRLQLKVERDVMAARAECGVPPGVYANALLRAAGAIQLLNTNDREKTAKWMLSEAGSLLAMVPRYVGLTDDDENLPLSFRKRNLKI